LNRLEVAVANPVVTGAGSLKGIVRKEHRRVRRLVKALPENPPSGALHDVRKAVKRARYAAELADDAGVSGAGRYVKRARALQDVLGEHQDAVVAAAALAQLDAELHRPMARMAAGSLIRAQDRRRAASRARLPKHWRRLDAAAGPFA
jgi:CHAD domain-containing protein